jgi:VIT1/CCC1 family predicted Fe2+/Mn2+ transporter
MRLHLIEDGNISSLFRVLLGVVGALMIILPTEFMAASWLWFVILMTGLLLLAIAGFASRAHVIKLKPFDNSYKNVRKTYEADDEGGKPKL